MKLYSSFVVLLLIHALETQQLQLIIFHTVAIKKENNVWCAWSCIWSWIFPTGEIFCQWESTPQCCMSDSWENSSQSSFKLHVSDLCLVHCPCTSTHTQRQADITWHWASQNTASKVVLEATPTQGANLNRKWLQITQTHFTPSKLNLCPTQCFLTQESTVVIQRHLVQGICAAGGVTWKEKPALTNCK